MNPGGRPVRIAHAYGNNRRSLKRALTAEIDMIEVDIWYHAGDIVARHERRLGALALLGDRRTPGHAPGFLSVPVGRGYYMRPDVRKLRLGEVLATVGGKRRLLLDVKGNYRGQELDSFASVLKQRVAEHDAAGWVASCGQNFAIMDAIRAAAPELEVRYSIQRRSQWDAFVSMALEDKAVREVCIHHRFLDDEKRRFAEQHGVSCYCWTVDDPEEAARLVALGADGITSNSLALLAALPERAG